MIFQKSSEFLKEFKKLSKKYRSLDQDFQDLENFLENCPTGDLLPREHIVQISKLGKEITGIFYKVRKFYCKSLKSNKDIRIIYRYIEETELIEFEEINFIEIYHKNQKENHDFERIKKYDIK